MTFAEAPRAGLFARIAATGRAARRTGGLVMMTAVVLLAFNLRPAVNALGVVLQEIQASTGLGDSAAGVLTALPTLSFAVVGFTVAGIASRVGPTVAVAGSLALLTVGQLLRATGSTWALFAGSVLALGAITFGNVLLPGLIRRYFPTAIGPMTAVYTTVLMIGQTVGAGLTPPLQSALGGTWRLGIGMWAATSAIALVPWIVALVRPPGGRRAQRPVSAADGAATGVYVEPGDPDLTSAPATSTATPSAPATAPARIPLGALVRSPRAWATAVFFGMQSLQAYVVFGWVPTVLTDAGMTVPRAALMLSIITATTIPVSAIVPAVLGAVRRHEIFVVVFVCSMALGYLGLTTMPLTAPIVQAILIGFGLSAFPMALMLFALRARTHEGTTALSGFGQSVGYLLASIGPFGFGLLRDLTHGSTVPLVVLMVTLIPMLLGGLVLVRRWNIEDDLPGRPDALAP